jgi:benzoyl-CoA reductase/2-hydroxyglutaryl-CoA dehydratase subunit BcrC/BadD/HgdB
MSIWGNGRMFFDLAPRHQGLAELRSSGKKLVGYIPNGYLPEELIWACGAVPIPLFRGGESTPVIASAKCLLRFLDPFCRAQIGYRILERDTLYQNIDLLIVPVTDNHIRAIADSWDLYTDVPVHRLGIPHAKTNHGFSYYVDGLHLVKEKLEELTGTGITDQRLREEIILSNKIRDLLRKICLERISDPPFISGKEFMRLNQACLYTDRYRMFEILEPIYKKGTEKKNDILKRPRLLLTGSTLAMGDYKVHDLIEQNKASIVIEEFCEGTKCYWNDVITNGNLLKTLADCYFMKRVPGAFFRGAAHERFEFLLKLIKEFKVDGVIWYSLMYRDSYDAEGHLFGSVMSRLKIPFLKISSEYDDSEKGALQIKIETFIEILLAVSNNAL